MIPISSGVRVWIASGHCDMRTGMQGLALLVQEGLGRDPFKCGFHKVRDKNFSKSRTPMECTLTVRQRNCRTIAGL
uniref:IS66 family insertion sequence element accessory protein TnpB n=1 Tax=Sinorhizobium medicae TaxID=110321 RepID=UPI0009DB7375